MRLLFLLILSVTIGFSEIFYSVSELFSGSINNVWQDDPKGKKEKKEKKQAGGKGKKKTATNKKNVSPANSKISVVQSWTMPPELTEISGITFISPGKIACIQDESAIIFVYDLTSKKIVNRYSFGSPGDYEDIAYGNGKFYVLRSDGIIYEINPESSGSPVLHKTGLSIAQDCEGLCFDKDSGNLLVAVKAKDPKQVSRKGIYIYDLKQRKLLAEVKAFINLGHKLLVDPNKKKDTQENRFEPSGLAQHPVSGEFYMTNGGRSSLLILSAPDNILMVTPLDKQFFPQPEGIAFSESGDLYISSEGGGKGEGLIHKCKLIK